MISPISPANPLSLDDTDMHLESWGGSTEDAPSHPHSISPLHHEREEEAQYIEHLYKGTLADLKLRSGQRIKDIEMVAAEEHKDNEISKKILQQVNGNGVCA